MIQKAKGLFQGSVNEDVIPELLQPVSKLYRIWFESFHIKPFRADLAPDIFPIGGSVVHAIFWEICWPSLFHCDGLRNNDLHTKVIHSLLNVKYLVNNYSELLRAT
jgi:hypothetical protein